MIRLLLPLILFGMFCLCGCRAKPSAVATDPAKAFPGSDIELEVDEVPAVYLFIGSRDLKLDPEEAKEVGRR